ncbi:unnamed protein product [Diamesa serratosioi]
MMNILVILVDLKQYKFTVISFNPFVLNNDDTRGQFWHMELNSDTIDDATRSIDGIFERKVKNLYGYPLNVIMFEPEVDSKPITDGNSVRYKHLDGMIAQMFQSYLNCRINYLPPSDNTLAGIRYPNGSFTGVLLELEKGRVDFSGNVRLMMPVGTTNTTFLKPIDSVNLKYMVPKYITSIVPLNYTVLQLFNYQARLLFLVVFIFMFIVWYFLGAFKIHRENSLGFQELIFYIVSTTSGVGLCARKFTRNHDRIMLVFLMMFSMIICNTFQGVVTRNLSSPGKSKDINSLEDLIKSDLKLMALVQIKELFKPNADESNVNQIQKKLYHRQINDFNQMGHLVEDLGIKRKKIGVLAREFYLFAARAKYYDHITGKDVIHIVDETPITFYSSFIVPKTSPFITVFNSVIYLIREAGFIEHSLKTNIYRIELQRIERYKKGLINHSTTHIISLQHISNLFIFWFICISCCLIVFIGELIMFKNEQSVTMFDIDKKVDLDSIKNEVIKNLHSTVSLLFYNGLNDSLVHEINDMGDELVSPSTTKGYVVITGSLSILKHSVMWFENINTNGKWMIFVTDLELQDVKSFLRDAWINNKMLNILIVLITSKQLKFNVISYNPFILNDDESRGQFWNKELNPHTKSLVLNYINGLFETKIKNLHHYPLKVIMFESEMTAMPIYDDKRNITHYKYMEGIVVQMFQSYLNCSIEYLRPRDNGRMGFRAPNGSLSGVLVEIEEGSVDFTGNVRLMMPIGTINTTFLHPIDMVYLKYIVPKMDKLVTTLDFTILQFFDSKARICFLLVFILLMIFWMLAGVVQKLLILPNEKNVPLMSFSDKLFYLISMQSGVSIPTWKFTRNYDRIIMSFLLLFSLIVCNAFQGAVTSKLSTNYKSRDINTLEELINSDLKLVALVVIPDLFKPNADESNVNKIQKQLYKRQVIDPTKLMTVLELVGRDRVKMGLLARHYFGIEARAKYYDHETGEDTLHIVEEIPISFYSTFIVPKKSPFIKMFNSAIHLIRESGFLEHSIGNALYEAELLRIERWKKGLIKDQKLQIITVQHIKHVFIFWAACLVFCTIVLFGEIVLYNFNKNELNSFDYID